MAIGIVRVGAKCKYRLSMHPDITGEAHMPYIGELWRKGDILTHLNDPNGISDKFIDARFFFC